MATAVLVVRHRPASMAGIRLYPYHRHSVLTHDLGCLCRPQAQFAKHKHTYPSKPLIKPSVRSLLCAPLLVIRPLLRHVSMFPAVLLRGK